MDEGVAKKEGISKKVIVLLVVIGILIVGLILGFFVFTKSETTDESSDYVVPEDKVLFLYNLRKEANNAETEAEAIEMFDRNIEGYKNTELWVGVQLKKAMYLCDVGKSSEALELLDKISNEELSSSDKMETFLTYEYVYDKIGDETKAKEYDNKYWEEYGIKFNGGSSVEQKDSD